MPDTQRITSQTAIQATSNDESVSQLRTKFGGDDQTTLIVNRMLIFTHEHTNPPFWTNVTDTVYHNPPLLTMDFNNFVQPKKAAVP